ncbi:PilZ domain-containing protein [Sphingomonas sp. GCM10030256]|uniref:PilZ domain-containing protein n=1 Tax=Sphingomonas sp. GCM10030256 TaxID=3273427 RepID=UPI00361D2F94
MDESSKVQNRRERRSNVLMAAALEYSGRSLAVKMRNLSSDGALVEGDNLPIEGAEIVFRRQELAVPGRVVWVRAGRAGLSFAEPLTPEAVLRHVPTPKPRVLPEFRRPGLGNRTLSAEEKMLGEQWICRAGADRPGE